MYEGMFSVSLLQLLWLWRRQQLEKIRHVKRVPQFHVKTSVGRDVRTTTGNILDSPGISGCLLVDDTPLQYEGAQTSEDSGLEKPIGFVLHKSLRSDCPTMTDNKRITLSTLRQMSEMFFVILLSGLSVGLEALQLQPRTAFRSPRHDNTRDNLLAKPPQFSRLEQSNRRGTYPTASSSFTLSMASTAQSSGMSTEQSRRQVLVWGSSFATAAGAASIGLPLSLSNKQQQPMTISDSIQWIDQFCDRRFLHAVVASDYRFLYRGIPAATADNSPVVQENPVSDLLAFDTYKSSEALNYFQNLEGLLKEESVRPSNGHLATTSAPDATAWGGAAASVWPVSEAHFAWYQTGGLFYPRPKDDRNLRLDRSAIIVDGKDCGSDSLEDALSSARSTEILFSARSFLSVPVFLEEQLREELRGSFLV